MLIELLSAQLGSRQMPTEVLWQAVLGVTYQYTAGHLPELLYSDYCSFLKVRVCAGGKHCDVWLTLSGGSGVCRFFQPMDSLW